MPNVRNPILAILLLAMTAAPTVVSADDQSSRRTAPALDMNAKMQQKLNARLNGKLDGAEMELDVEADLSKRVEAKNAEVNEQLDAQSSTLTDAQRGAEDEKKETEEKHDTTNSKDAQG